MKNKPSNKTVRKANLLKLQKPTKPTGKFWNDNSNSNNNMYKDIPSMALAKREESYKKMREKALKKENSSSNNNSD